MKIRTLPPKEVQKYIEQNEAFSRSGDQVSQSTIIGSQQVETILPYFKLRFCFSHGTSERSIKYVYFSF